MLASARLPPIANWRSPQREGRQVKPYSTRLIAIGADKQLSLCHAFSREDSAGASASLAHKLAGRMRAANMVWFETRQLTTMVIPSTNSYFSATLLTHLARLYMNMKPSQKTFRLSAIVAGHIIDGTVAFSPAPQPGIFTELAAFEAQRILAHLVTEEIAAGRL
jgi:hypothetical protein